MSIEKISVNGKIYDIADVEGVEAEKRRAQQAESDIREGITWLESVLDDGSFVVGIANLANAVKAGAITFDMLDGKLQLSVSVVDNLKTANTLMPLSANQGKILKELIDIINGTGEGSTDKKITDAIAALVDSAPENLDTLRELAEWIAEHGAEFAAVVKTLQAHSENLANLNTTILNYNRKMRNYAPVDKATVVANLGTAVERGMIVTYYTTDGWKSIRYISSQATAEAFADMKNWEDVDDFSAKDKETLDRAALSFEVLPESDRVNVAYENAETESTGVYPTFEIPAATTEKAGVMSMEDKLKLNKLFPVQCYITSGNIRIDTLEKKIYCEDIRVIDTKAKVIIAGTSSLKDIRYDYNSLYSSTLPINLALMVNPEMSASFIANGESDEALSKIDEGYVIIGYFRTISNTLLCSIDKYSVDGVVYYNTVDERIWIQDNPKFYSLPILDKTDVPFAQDKVLFQNGTLESSSLNVSDFIVALPGIVLYNLRTPGNTEYYAAITFYDDRKRCIGYYNGAASSVISEYMPVISDDCRYLRFTTEKGTNPSISFKLNYLTSLEHKVDTIKSDTINAIRGNKLNISNTPNAIIEASNGTLTINSSYQSSVSDYIGVKGLDKVCLYNLRTPGAIQYAAIIGYDDDKNIVTSFRSINTIEDIYEYSIPDDVSYIRFTSNDLTTLYSFDIRPKESIIVIGSSSAQRLEKNNLGNFSLSSLQDSPIYWRGVGGEDMQAITARSGMTPLFSKSAFTIPSIANERVEITGFITDGKDCVFTSQQGNNLPKLNPVVINGVEGNIVYENSKFYFYRLKSGESVEVAESDVISPNDVKYRDSILVAMLGYNGGYTGVEEYISYHEKARIAFNNSKYLFITRLCDGGWTNITTIKEEENVLTDKYGTNVLKLRDWLSRFGVKYAISLGLLSSETLQDISDRENGYVPTSLRGDGVHLNNIGYQVLSYKINELLSLISK